ncbi:unnamed protein product [Acanthoscelides obtectus]|uniref:Uncharacterized protein n=1 Tax=Acanthoscelides obtectus TaxID=200917 RepID=A0A9P0Q2B9_ACAOB|nr:unnamed protein product [Acanthoscelides obtectus]CAK1685302.1 hypothetical protein AOBTE_LOCUS35317 [Acanthoscelides obtectus]
MDVVIVRRWSMVSDCRTRRYHPAVLVGGARMCACCMHTCSLARVRAASPLSHVSPYSPTAFVVVGV